MSEMTEPLPRFETVQRMLRQVQAASYAAGVTDRNRMNGSTGRNACALQMALVPMVEELLQSRQVFLFVVIPKNEPE